MTLKPDLAQTLFRAKGFIHAIEKPQRRLAFQLVGRRATVSVSGPWGEETPRTRLVFIARRGTVNFTAVETALNGCVASADLEADSPRTVNGERA